MTPYTHHISDNYLDAYISELNRDLAEANRGETFSRSLSGRVARTLVRVGAWMLQDRPELVSDTILVLPKQQDTSTIRKAA
jgi:hypothetical protein